MLHPNIIEVVKKLVQHDIQIRSVFTNGLADTRLYREFTDVVKTNWLVNLNHPETYNAREWELLNRNLELLKWDADKGLIGHRGFDLGSLSLQFAITFYRPDQDYHYIIEMAKKYNSANITYDVSHPCSDKSNAHIDFERLVKVKPVLMKFLKECVREEIKPDLGDILPPCIFTSEEIRFLLLHAGFTSICKPCLDLFPDLKVEYCTSMRGIMPSYSIEAMTLPEIASKQIMDANELRGFCLPRCKNCSNFLNMDSTMCQGYCLRYKVDKQEGTPVASTSSI